MSNLFSHISKIPPKRAAKTDKSYCAPKVTACLWSKLWILIEFVCMHILCLLWGVEIVNTYFRKKNALMSAAGPKAITRLVRTKFKYLVLKTEL